MWNNTKNPPTQTTAAAADHDFPPFNRPDRHKRASSAGMCAGRAPATPVLGARICAGHRRARLQAAAA